MTEMDRTTPIIVAGSARCLFADLATLPAGLPILAVNYAGLCIREPVAHLASYHAESIGLIAQLRAVTRHSLKGAPPEVHATRQAPGVTRVWPESDGGGGSSGLFGVRVALGLGYATVILAGMPLDDSGRCYEAPDAKRFDFSASYLDAWVRAMPGLYGKVLSCSGMTKTLLGGP